jgi:hypothetical protein
VKTECLFPLSSGCELNDNDCVCTNTSFVSQVATCLGQNCPTEVASFYDLEKTNCALYGGYTVAIDKRTFLDISGTLSSWLDTNFWSSSIPDCARNNCFSPLMAASGCEIDNNQCVCTNATLLKQMAICTGRECANSAVLGVYSEYSSSCTTYGGYTMALSQSDWLSAAGISDSISTLAVTGKTVLRTATSTLLRSMVSIPSPTDSSTTSTSTAALPEPTASGGGHLTKDQQIALGVGLGMGLPALLIAATGLYFTIQGHRKIHSVIHASGK